MKTAAGVDIARLRRLLEELVAIPSVNPALDGGEGEAALAAYVEAHLVGMGAEVERQEVEPGRANVVARFRSDDAAPTILFDAHLDTVAPSGDATTTPRWDGDAIYGRGTCDDKGSLAAMLETARRYASQPGEPTANLIVTASVDEEVTGTGAVRLKEVASEAQLLVVGEPTRLDLGVSHKGTTRFEIEVRGIAAHSSEPKRGRSAIRGAARLVEALEIAVPAALGDTANELVGPPTVSVARIRGGTAMNVVPASCTVAVDVRRPPACEPEDVFAAVAAAIRDTLPDWDVTVHEPSVNTPALANHLPDAIVDRLVATARGVGIEPAVVGFAFGTNACFMASPSAPAIVVGPGDIRDAHGDHEHVELGEVMAATRLYGAILDHAPEIVGGR